jgi:phytoene dehydrogenase-like protein
MHIYDYVIIGSGLTGLTIASKISEESKNVLILESENHTGGAHRPATLQNQTIENGLRFYPNTDLNHLSVLAKSPRNFTISCHIF